ncbi:hypothetical protein BV20DRAFT_478876 [Pilatotrama ljubarskyi]|nr:hypothetical protein BV20DRAFT_478876 [Pilatotrama ljubarskyi]
MDLVRLEALLCTGPPDPFASPAVIASGGLLDLRLELCCMQNSLTILSRNCIHTVPVIYDRPKDGPLVFAHLLPMSISESPGNLLLNVVRIRRAARSMQAFALNQRDPRQLYGMLPRLTCGIRWQQWSPERWSHDSRVKAARMQTETERNYEGVLPNRETHLTPENAVVTEVRLPTPHVLLTTAMVLSPDSARRLSGDLDRIAPCDALGSDGPYPYLSVCGRFPSAERHMCRNAIRIEIYRGCIERASLKPAPTLSTRPKAHVGITR